MLTKKLLAAIGLAGALMLGLTAPAEARGWRGGGFHRGPVIRGGFHRGPVFRGPVYRDNRRAEIERRREERNQWRREHNPSGYR